jgi:cyclophilin family peptidyl-prolyl cis-trans isomerase
MMRACLAFVILVLVGCSSTPKEEDLSLQSVLDVKATQKAVKEAQQETQKEVQAEVPKPPSEEAEKVVKIKIETSQGNILADLYPVEAPKTVENFIKLAKKGFYDGLIFHRVIPGFMIQTGDPAGTGRGGPGYTFEDEFSKKLRHDQPGVISMANSGPNTNGSQFFITEVPTPWLNDKHSVFGRVTSGLDIVSAIARVPRDADDKPIQDVVMKKVTVLEES